jgi:hypothetical protein
MAFYIDEFVAFPITLLLFGESCCDVKLYTSPAALQ